MSDDDRILRDRLVVLVGAGREDWPDVRRRARVHGYRQPHPWIWLALATAALAVAAGPPLVGRSVLDLFRDPAKPPLPRTTFAPLQRLSFDRQYGKWSVHEVANDGRTVFYSIRNGDGELVCVAHGRTDWKSAGWRSPFGSMSCGAPGSLLSAERPLYYQVTIEDSTQGDGPRPFRVTGVAADGVETVVLTGTGERMEVPVADHAFTITRFPADAQSIEIAAIDEKGKVLFREPLIGFGSGPDLPVEPTPSAIAPDSTPAPLVPKRGERPLQRARSADVELRVYRDGLVIFRMKVGSRAARLVTPRFGCLKYTEIDGETYPVWTSGTGNLAFNGTTLNARAIAPLVDPPYDGCEIRGNFGRRRNGSRGVRSPVEVPLTERGRKFFETRAAAR